MVLKAVLLSVLIPPTCFLYLSVAGVILARRHRRVGRAAVIIGFAGLLLLGLPVIPGALILALEQNLPVVPPADDMPRAIVILGGDVSRTTEAPFAKPGLLTLDRLRSGAAMHRETGLPILVTGGVVQIDRPPVATLMADSLRDDFQVPVEWIENASLDTWQNAAFTAAILKRQGIHSIYLVTQAWHMRRALVAFRDTGLVVTAAPTAFDPPFDPIALDFVPRAVAWQWSYFALHEWIGYAWYALR